MAHHIDASDSHEPLDRAVARVARRRHGVFTSADVATAGGSRGMVGHRLRTGRWERLYRDVYRLAGAPATWRQSLVAVCLSAGERAAASHRSASPLFRFPNSDERFLEITVTGRRRIRRAGVIIHSVVDLPSVDVTIVDAIPVTTPARTLIDLAAVAPADVAEEALDYALRTRLVTVSRLRWRLTELGGSGRRGTGIIRTLLNARAPASPTPESVLETRLLRLLKRRGLPAPVLQHQVKVAGRPNIRIDFAYPDVRLAVEAEGYGPHSGRLQWQRDLARRNALTALGWDIVHVTAEDLQRRPEVVVATITAALGRQARIRTS